MMRKIIFITCVFSLCLFAVSCEKDIEDFLGSYTYKISGTVGLIPTYAEDCSLKPDTLYLSLSTEQGQMNIAHGDASSKVVVTWNDMLGDVCHTTASVKNKSIVLEENRKNASVWSGVLSCGGYVTFSGNGKLYDNMLILSLEYGGEFTVSGRLMTIVSSDVECVAKANE